MTILLLSADPQILMTVMSLLHITVGVILGSADQIKGKT